MEVVKIVEIVEINFKGAHCSVWSDPLRRGQAVRDRLVAGAVEVDHAERAIGNLT